jgi:hypothetical protein
MRDGRPLRSQLQAENARLKVKANSAGRGARRPGGDDDEPPPPPSDSDDDSKCVRRLV